jgi:unsaturated rhamnogalacturonyl hydrolase
MFGMVLNRWGEDVDDARLRMMSEQIAIFGSVLQNDDGFMRHAQDWPGYDESVIWARGNSWVVASLADYLRILVRRGESDPVVQRVFIDHVRAIASVQQESDLWLTVMSHPEEPDNYLETSATALFAYGMARAYRYGILGDEERRAAQRAVASIEQTRIRQDDDGPVVTGVSVATDPWSLEEYLAVPVEDDVNYGVGSVILALIETSGLPD